MKYRIAKMGHFLNRHIGLEILLNGLIITILLEALNRRSVSASFAFLLHSPHPFLCNVLIVSFTLCASLFFGAMRGLVQALISLVWLILGTVNFVILGYRMTPFSAEDIKLAKLAMQIANNYLTPITMGLLVSAIIGVLALVIFLIRHFPRESTRRSLISVCMKTAMIGLALYVFVKTGMQTSALSETFENLAEAYEDYGFAYCFSNSIVDVGISKPADYSEQRMQDIARVIREHETANGIASGADTDLQPNILMIQLESFFDPSYMKDFSFSEDPIPTFRALKEAYPSGYLTVPVVGAGTANTEFEALTGMSTDYFGAGEYPYNTVLSDTTCESLAYILGGMGYHTSVIHNHRGTFYKRNQVFSKLGFDCFIPKEYLYDMEFTPMGWAKDNVFPGTILDVMEQSDSPDFIYGITVQSHGRYPAETRLEDPLIKVTAKEESVNVNPVAYYVNELREVDDVIADLTNRLSKLDEPTVLILYGDHLPALGYTSEDLTQPSLYMTEYVIWSNFDLGLEDQPLGVESLGANVLTALGISNGILPKFHRAYDGTEEYDEALHLVEYDMLYGDGYLFECFSDEMPKAAEEGEETEGQSMQRGYAPSMLSYGVFPIVVTSCDVIDDELYVYGENFNASSRIVLDGKIKSTTYLDSHTLLMNESVPETDVDQLRVLQCDPDNDPMGEGSNVLLEIELG